MTELLETRRFPDLEEQKVVYDVMRDHFNDTLTDATADQHLMDETALFLMIFDEAKLASDPIELLSRAALHDALQIRSAKDLSPEMFL